MQILYAQRQKSRFNLFWRNVLSDVYVLLDDILLDKDAHPQNIKLKKFQIGPQTKVALSEQEVHNSSPSQTEEAALSLHLREALCLTGIIKI